MNKLFFKAVLLFFTTHAHAVFGPLTFVPAQPTSNEQVSLRVRVGICDTIVSVPTNFPDPDISVVGTTIRVTKVGISTDDAAACINSPATFAIQLPNFPTGIYSVELYLRQAFIQNQIRLVQTGSLAVTQGAFQAQQVPSLSFSGIFIMLLLILLGTHLALIRERG